MLQVTQVSQFLKCRLAIGAYKLQKSSDSQKKTLIFDFTVQNPIQAFPASSLTPAKSLVVLNKDAENTVKR